MKMGIGAGVGPVLLVILIIFVVLGYKRMMRSKCRKSFISFLSFSFISFLQILSPFFFELYSNKLIYSVLHIGYAPYVTLHFDKIISMILREKPIDSEKADVASVHSHSYANLNEDGEPLHLVSGTLRQNRP